jgi:hypothetical protein
MKIVTKNTTTEIRFQNETKASRATLHLLPELRITSFNRIIFYFTAAWLYFAFTVTFARENKLSPYCRKKEAEMEEKQAKTRHISRDYKQA